MVSLGDLAEVNPSPPAHSVGEHDPVSFIPMEDVSESAKWTRRQARPLGHVRRGYTAFAEGDVLVAKITPCLENGKGCHATGLANGLGYGTTEFHVLRARPGVSARLVYHLTTDATFRALAKGRMTGSAGQQRVPTSFLASYPVPEFSGDEQDAIAAVLDAADAQVEQAEAGIAKRRRLRVGLVQDLLTRGLNEDGRCRDEATHPFQDTPLGRLPAQWDLKRLAEIAGFITKGSTPTTHGFDWVDEGVLFLRSESVQTSGFTLSGSMFISEAAHAAMTRSVILGGDLLMSITGYIGHVCRYPVGMPEANINQHIARIRVDEAQADSAFVLHALADWRVQRRLELEVTGLAYPQIGLKQVREILLPIPPPDEQRRIVAVLGGADAEIVAEEAVLAKLRRVKAGLMRDLLTGDVPVQALLDQAALA